MNSVPNSLEESFYEWFSGVTAPGKYLVLVDNEKTDSETGKFDAERPKVTEAQLEAGVKSQKFKTFEESQEESSLDGRIFEVYREEMEELYGKFIFCVVCFFLLGFAAASWISCLLLCNS
ncbi:hypothetical protein T4D_9225 [Trichinella pseudospiralis]|uniref:Uncharacterized protein n=1 Tax=Trichinella pseudospiralis TaxID=6337 RepID=A0A0V1FL24_TRIPS|nr:hypothetical protein T4D_9225 [Trichinella pseudospiralis]